MKIAEILRCYIAEGMESQSQIAAQRDRPAAADAAPRFIEFFAANIRTFGSAESALTRITSQAKIE